MCITACEVYISREKAIKNKLIVLLILCKTFYLVEKTLRNRCGNEFRIYKCYAK